MGKVLYVSHPSSLEHDTGDHPECAERIVAIEQELAGRGWESCVRVQAPTVERAVLEAVHPGSYVDSIERVSERGGGMLDMDTVASAGSFEAALHSAGGAVHAVDALFAGDARAAFCGLRPPGHHAEAERAMGFCLFNNAAVAARRGLDQHGAGRVLVLDWDVHHGNGTNDIFYSSDSVLYASIHQSPLYPGTGSMSDNGTGAGEGHTVNLPVPPGSGHEEWLSLVQHVVVPIARSQRPGLLIVSAGYDGHRDDPLASCTLTDGSFGAMTGVMRDLSNELDVPLLLVLEGGYELGALARSVAATIEAAAGSASPETAAAGPLAQAARTHYSRWWPSLGTGPASV
jgi:acetoin utilization deacetylase AcuC-like enzyme